jgi:hypothetical protein
MAKMMLPYLFDVVPEQIGMVLSKLIKWQPEEKRVLLAIEESGDPTFNGKIISGKIMRVNYNHLGKPHDAIIQLDSPLNILGRSIIWIVASPRFKGHGLYRLLVTWSVVHIFPIDTPELANELVWENMIAISLMKLERRFSYQKITAQG